MESQHQDELLRVGEESFFSVFKYAAIGMALVAPDGRWLKVNPALCASIGYSEEELLHRTFQDITHPDDLEVDLENVRQLLAGKISSYHMEKRYCHRDGHVVWALLSVSLVRDEREEPLYFISQIQDITERKKIELEIHKARVAAENASRAKTEFLANMSHEIRTPLNAIIGLTDLLTGTKLTAEQRDFLETIHASGENLLTIVDDVLDFSKIEFGKLEFDSHPFHLPDLIESVVGMLDFRITSKKLGFTSHLESGVPADYLGDATRIRQVLINLLSNAIKFTEQGQISLEVGPGAIQPGDKDGTQRLLFRVRDTGIGIPPERMERLFKIFSQVDASTTRRYGGSGLGLAICQKLVDLMGGTIRAESQPGHGSVFSFEIPLTLAAPGKTANRHRAVSNSSSSAAVVSGAPSKPPLEILVVEDNLTNQKVAKQMLKRLGYEADIARDGVEAVHAVENKGYDLILMDVHMPQMDGLEATRRIRGKVYPHGAPKIIALTADVLKGEREVCLDAGMDDYLTKPIKIEVLKTVIENLPKQKSMTADRQA